MSITQLVTSFVTDDQTKAILALIALDFLLGVAAAFKLGTFRLSYVANFARNDVLGKVVPFFALHAAGDVAGGTNIVIPGFDISAISGAVFVAVAAALVGSVLKSLADFGFTALPAGLAGSGSDVSTGVTTTTSTAPARPVV